MKIVLTISAHRAQRLTFHVSLIVDGMFGADLAFFVIKVDPIMESADCVILDFVQENMLETGATNFARCS